MLYSIQTDINTGLIDLDLLMTGQGAEDRLLADALQKEVTKIMNEATKLSAKQIVERINVGGSRRTTLDAVQKAMRAVEN